MQLSLFDENVVSIDFQSVAYEDFVKASRIVLRLTRSQIDDVITSEDTPLALIKQCQLLKNSDKFPKNYFDLVDRAYGKPRTMPEPVPPQEAEPLFEQHSEILTAEDLDTLLKMDKLRERVSNHIKNK